MAPIGERSWPRSSYTQHSALGTLTLGRGISPFPPLRAFNFDTLGHSPGRVCPKGLCGGSSDH